MRLQGGVTLPLVMLSDCPFLAAAVRSRMLLDLFRRSPRAILQALEQSANSDKTIVGFLYCSSRRAPPAYSLASAQARAVSARCTV